MKIHRIILPLILVLSGITLKAENEKAEILPDTTYLYARKDSNDLYLDIYYAREGCMTHYNGKRKPSIIFVFPGGFFMGSKSETYLTPWYKAIVEQGYNLIAIDYRLGLKDVERIEFTPKFQDTFSNAIGLAVEDLFSATEWLTDNGREIGIDAENLVICGASAGAITVLQAEWELCNRTKRSEILPENYNYAGAIAFSGAVYSTQGPVRYNNEPCPTLLLHGTKDHIVNYTRLAFMNIHFEGSSVLARTYDREGYNYRIFRFEGNSHEISTSMEINIPYIERFIEENVIEGKNITEDALVTDPRITTPGWAKGNFLRLFNKRDLPGDSGKYEKNEK